MKHIPVLRDETIDGLQIQSGDIVLDGTLGGGGHSLEIAHRFGSGVKIIGLDLDADAIIRAESALENIDHDTIFRVANFQEMDKILKNLNIIHVDKILLDLGLSSYQLEVAGRGFSFKQDEPLLMTMKKDIDYSDLTAREIVNNWEEKSLADVIYGFGEEKYSRKIARAIILGRNVKPIETTFDLVKIIEDAVGKSYRGTKIHPATRTFQALRIATNSELTNLEEGIRKGWELLSNEGRMAIISFHSLEDRIVKRAFVDFKEKGFAQIITKKPIIPSIDELKANPRARSAKLRIIKKL